LSLRPPGRSYAHFAVLSGGPFALADDAGRCRRWNLDRAVRGFGDQLDGHAGGGLFLLAAVMPFMFGWNVYVAWVLITEISD
jgi:hypothetical protein